MPVYTTPTTPSSIPSSATIGAPTFDPYAAANPATTPPTLGTTTPYWSGGTSAPPTYTAPAPYASPYTAPAPYSPGSPVVPPPPTAGTYTVPGYTQQPPVLIPGAPGVPPPVINWPQPEQGRYMRLFQEVRFSETWLAGKDSTNQMQTHDLLAATTMNFPNFFWSGRPLRVSPTFVLSLWDGPDNPAAPAELVDFPSLPPQVYAAYLGFGWAPMLTPQFGFDLEANVGVFSDFETANEDSLRVPSVALAVLNLTPTLTLKGGIEYLDRVDVEWLPAFGVLWQPNPQTRWDIYFPRPKLASYLTTIGNTDMWWYLMGEYGGGSWTVSRPTAGDDLRMDINDIRIGVGLEWRNPASVRSFVEAAYVFDREIVYASGANADIPLRQTLGDTLMLRGGFAF